jgi:hypothetical protein
MSLSDFFVVVNFHHFAKHILKKGYFITYSSSFFKTIFQNEKIKEIAKNHTTTCNMKGCLRFFTFIF